VLKYLAMLLYGLAISYLNGKYFALVKYVNKFIYDESHTTEYIGSGCTSLCVAIIS